MRRVDRRRAAEAQPERVVARLRRHGRVLALPVVFALAIAGAAGYLAGTLEPGWQSALMWSAAAVGVVFLVVLPFMSWLTRRWTITTRRVILRHGVFVRVRKELLHSSGHRVEVRRGPLQAVFGSGDVRIDTDRDMTVVLKDVPGPAVVQAALLELMDAQHPAPAERRRDEPAHADDTIAWGRR
ncbi:PH domain-containing protein [Agromyces archimandritae]|uniref:PH domain-containing protein n=1 Tax=Agromyces archimandritae TaxID=2781962 RepID=A0A975FMR4_9MICO|nr:PH domain-containing protein [Agromyces archimandritae]QTX05295.1 PH domain-containing protein [Agromyces archimandritae]